ncbi:hypothetical protein A3H80_04800 [Candidatus Roizmanbacteria bacterium RIFCSPLOWO2_02_FULL_37_19]|uniref:Homoserine dehydrogenase n=1 Tax=Candidatus Roizmanbacteria bacterium RIFCSPHIGHO2_02_FULL_37_24 TaxID=1802037 RepID=A0A1F7GXE3_9BACT|nr:MAG: hypothetical protein A2862_02180 [Candidatus Roizmanbacteria bacterium RIFCSPHIGHO2_01_FULL_38_41]OGK23206.1 MAG: hypothetical protein A3C24_00935 [Candidatus Roizmanbacteria bacterium RIFCSPHIGHO2_02_FULL_37_24]OGK43619.1 MAG: hypothetical protein A2956_04280 [Candidatus Roizmanbacteria bacterium RIFCSPLOWO2_01_FULL_37_57]OGK54799.1 MAG: hypothetical protein A3H80_04800 [Candidatus Roizmanbacteria bacterium RIFCSPLOWO2_02_FULL_37_19]
MKLHLIHFGPGNVGREFQRQLQQVRSSIRKEYGIDVTLQRIFDKGDKPSEILKVLQNLSGRNVLIDTTAAEEIYAYIYMVLKQGHFAVLSNKKPISLSQGKFDKLYSFHHRSQRLFFETTVGAGLPVISTIQELIHTGDEIQEIQGCFSGTLGYIFSQLDKGKKFSEAVKEAKIKGFTEPDPRDDLSGLDVARKALILNRIIGQKRNLQEIRITPLFTPEMAKLPVDDFLSQLITLDKTYANRLSLLRKQDKTLRYVATITRKKVTVALEEVSTQSDIGSLQGPDNIVVIKTKRYYNNPMVIKGPGAGIQVTAAGVLGDVIKIVKRISKL